MLASEVTQLRGAIPAVTKAPSSALTFQDVSASALEWPPSRAAAAFMQALSIQCGMLGGMQAASNDRAGMPHTMAKLMKQMSLIMP